MISEVPSVVFIDAEIVRFKLQFVPSTDDDSEDCFIPDSDSEDDKEL